MAPFPRTDAVTAFDVTGVRTNVDSSKVLIAEVTYDEGGAVEVWELLPLRVVPQ